MKKVTMETTKGTITLVLDDEKAPETVKNFVRYAQDGHHPGSRREAPGDHAGILQGSQGKRHHRLL